MRSAYFLSLAFVALAACSSGVAPEQVATPPAQQSQAATSDTVAIRLGQTVQVDGGRLELTFDARVDDSRCPANVMCVWQGDAQVRLGARVAGGARRTVELHSTLEPRVVEVERYAISFVGLMPYPGTEARDATPVVVVQVRR